MEVIHVYNSDNIAKLPPIEFVSLESFYTLSSSTDLLSENAQDPQIDRTRKLVRKSLLKKKIKEVTTHLYN